MLHEIETTEESPNSSSLTWNYYVPNKIVWFKWRTIKSIVCWFLKFHIYNEHMSTDSISLMEILGCKGCRVFGSVSISQWGQLEGMSGQQLRMFLQWSWSAAFALSSCYGWLGRVALHLEGTCGMLGWQPRKAVPVVCIWRDGAVVVRVKAPRVW